MQKMLTLKKKPKHNIKHKHYYASAVICKDTVTTKIHLFNIFVWQFSCNCVLLLNMYTNVMFGQYLYTAVLLGDQGTYKDRHCGCHTHCRSQIKHSTQITDQGR